MDHRKKAKEFLQSSKAKWQDEALWYMREKRDAAAKEVPEWEELRDRAQKIKIHTLKHIDHYLDIFVENAAKKGIQVHFAKDASDHNTIVFAILQKHRIKKVVKSKSMLTEECGLNRYLEERGVEVIDTDLGERVVQLAGQRPSHIVLPAIHMKKEEIGKLFAKKFHIPYTADPYRLTQIAKEDLRQHFFQAQGAITGVNFAIAQTGGFVVCTNEGNADLGTSLAKVHIASMGLEKLIPKLEHLAYFIRLLARSATGQPITAYTTHFNAPQKGQQLHIVIVDNGRREILTSKVKEALSCIRCGACLNTCPVYRRSGGHSYSYTIPGPIGSVLANAKDNKHQVDLAYACTLCSSCDAICPVKIPLHHQLLFFRKNYMQNHASFFKKSLYKWSAKIMQKRGMEIIRPLYPILAKSDLWKGHNFPKPAPKSFKTIYGEEHG